MLLKFVLESLGEFEFQGGGAEQLNTSLMSSPWGYIITELSKAGEGKG